MSGQLIEMKKTTELNKQAARVNAGQPFLNMPDIELFHQKESRSIWAVVKVANEGRTYADEISFAIHMDIFREPPSRPYPRIPEFKYRVPIRLQPMKL